MLPSSSYHRFNAVTGRLQFISTLEQSALNYVPKYPSYSGLFNAKKETEQYKRNEEVDDIYEGYQNNKKARLEEKEFKRAMQGVSDDITFNSFYDVDEPLIDRLYNYDKLMGTYYGMTFEEIPVRLKLFIERKEEEQYICFDDILEMIDKVAETDELKAVFDIYKKKKKA
jgi:hypothetical protein